MADKIVVVAKDPVKERLKMAKAKVKTMGAGTKLTQQEIEEVLKDILDHMGLK